MISQRQQKLRARFNALRIDAFLVTFLPHLRYLSGFSGSNGIGVVTKSGAYFLTDGRYADQVKKEVYNWKIFVTQNSLFEEAQNRKLIRSGMRIGFDGNTLSFDQFQQLKKMFLKTKFLPKAETIEKIAAIKDEAEIANIKRAVGITDRVFSEILSLVKPGVTELDLAAEISYRQRKHGAEADAFETIVASGERGALPHGRATTKKIKHGEFVTLDFGCIYNGYHSDLTRTIAVGKPKPEGKKIYTIVLDAQQKAIDAAMNGVTGKDLDAIARSHIRKNGYDKYFRHSLGHGLGLQIHEPPRISVLSTAVLETGNVITIEPGIYVPGFGGVRIEDDVVIRNGNCEVLNRSPKELLIL